ncbi:MAG: hypothetical protein A3D31_00670 [Candidatus Fluviicola riflensis]|nr:MAG: hypothetical protein CHH17_04875 [Candidatus Fluviicola riflensis]OGS76121.1 MAG: hypothetical protein A3D31_00670 [Candidatus Fluviicola riflensis]OGS82021.1 MAG: hypothetical protein A2724_16425 [Fluviicola sp. RIFCSPHIGHO2_01_FULL_43_53]OGS83480.1 MAG: hypothetical protein A3E30_16830 [Fluviicola sp. RIFCSPHIGHO2_12_FULL_43_24]
MTTGAVSAQTFTNAIDYNDHIVDLQNEIGYKMIAFNNEVGSETATAASVKPFYDDLLKTTKTVITKLEKVKPFEKNVELKTSAMELFRFYETTIAVDYREMIDLIFGDEFDDAALVRVQELLVKVTEAEAVVDAKFKTAQEAYALKYNIDLEENELQEEIDAE